MSAIVDINQRRHRLSVGDYYRMAEAGILKANDRVELIEGELIDMTPIGSRHAALVDRLNHLLLPALSSQAILRVQEPIRLGDFSEPEPDIAVVAFREDFYESAHPKPDDIYLLIEVADSSLPYDRDVKLPLYARHGVKEAWLVDIEAKTLQVFRSPERAGYATEFVAPNRQHMQIEAIPGTSFDLSRIFSSLITE